MRIINELVAYKSTPRKVTTNPPQNLIRFIQNHCKISLMLVILLHNDVLANRGCAYLNCTPKVLCLTFGVQFILTQFLYSFLKQHNHYIIISNDVSLPCLADS